MIKTVRFLLKFLAPFGYLLFLSIILGSATILANIGLMGTSAYLIAKAALHPSIATLQVAIVGVRFFGLSRGVFRYLERLVSHNLNFKLVTGLRVWLYQKIEPLAPGIIYLYNSGDLLNRLVADLDNLDDFYVRSLSPVAVAAIIIGSSSLFLGNINNHTGWILFCGMLLCATILPVSIFKITQKTNQKQVEIKNKLSVWMVDYLNGLDEILLYGKEKEFRKQAEELTQESGKNQIYQAFNNSLSTGINLLLTNLTLVMVILIVTPSIHQGKMEGFLLPVITLIILASFEAVNPLAATAQNMVKSIKSGTRIREISEVKPLVQDLPEPYTLEKEPLLIEVMGGGFRYATDEEWALRDIQLTIHPGEKIAILGPNGSGKTTIAYLMQRYYPLTEGILLLNGMDILKIREDNIRDLLTYVNPRPYFFNKSLRENLRMAKEDASDIELEEVIGRTGLMEWMSLLPAGLNTSLGENGWAMSGGEKQKLSLARVLLRKPSVVILDEPTANMDAITSRKIIPELIRSTEGKSLVWITHSLIGLEQMDQLIIMDQGRIVERGKYMDLIKAGGYFSKVWKIQQDQF